MPNLLLTMWDTIKSSNIGILVAAGLGMFAIIGGLSMLSYHYTLSGIKSRTVGDGQHGTARWATDKEIRQTYAHVPFKVRDWRKGVNLPAEQGLVLGCKGKKGELTALVDSDDIHCLMIAASGAGKTAFFLYPNLEYACASGMSFLALDTKGDLARNYGSIAKKYYGYKHISVIDLRNPTRSDGNNLLTLINRYMDIARKQPDNLAARAKAEKYAKILAKSIVSPEGNSDHGQNAFFYDAAEGLLSSTILLLAEFLPPDEEHPEERRHIVSVFKLVQDLLQLAVEERVEPGQNRGHDGCHRLLGAVECGACQPACLVLGRQLIHEQLKAGASPRTTRRLQQILHQLEYRHDVPPLLRVLLIRRQKLRKQQDRGGQQALRRIVEEGVLPVVGVPLWADDGLGEDLGVLLRLCAGSEVVRLFSGNVHIAVDERQQIVAVRAQGTLAGRRRTQQLRAGDGIRHVHGAVPAQLVPR